MTAIQKRGFLIQGKNQRKGGYLSLKENQLPSLKPELGDLKENESDRSDVNSVIEMPAACKRTLENTYKVSPDCIFPVRKVERIIHDVLEESLANEGYDLKNSKEKCKSICQTMKERVKALGMARYKLVALVHLGENQGQDIKISSQCIWNEEFDNYATGSYFNSSVFAQGIVYGIYFE